MRKLERGGRGGWEKKERESETVPSVGKLWKGCCGLFVHAHFCLHLWNACVLLWQPSQPLVLFFVRTPAFNRSGICHINTVRRQERLALNHTALCTTKDLPAGQWKIGERKLSEITKGKPASKRKITLGKQGKRISWEKGRRSNGMI